MKSIVCLFLLVLSSSIYAQKDSMMVVVDDDEVFIASELVEQIMLERTKEKQFDFYCLDGCMGFPTESPDNRKYKKREPFNIKLNRTKDSVKVSFKFKESCCLTFAGDVKRDEDQVELIVEIPLPEPCDCTCEYEHLFVLKAEGDYAKQIVFNGVELVGE